jgi:hypothetical protein
MRLIIHSRPSFWEAFFTGGLDSQVSGEKNSIGGYCVYRKFPSFLTYYRMHLSLGKDTLEARSVQPPELGTVIAIPQMGVFTTAMSAGQLVSPINAGGDACSP